MRLPQTKLEKNVWFTWYATAGLLVLAACGYAVYEWTKSFADLLSQ